MEDRVGNSKAARTYSDHRTTLNRPDVGKAITYVVLTGHPVDVPNVVEDVAHVCYIWRKCFIKIILSFRFKLNIGYSLHLHKRKHKITNFFFRLTRNRLIELAVEISDRNKLKTRFNRNTNQM